MWLNLRRDIVELFSDLRFEWRRWSSDSNPGYRCILPIPPRDLPIPVLGATPQPRPFSCPHCGADFACASNVAQHVRLKHWALLGQPMPNSLKEARVLDPRFPKRQPQSSGVSNIRYKEAWGCFPFECEVCTRSFGTSTGLQAHVARTSHMRQKLLQLEAEALRKGVSRSKYIEDSLRRKT